MTTRGCRELTYSVIVVSLIIAAEPDTHLWAGEIARRANMQRATVSRILQRMIDDGWLADRRDSNAPQGLQQPRRCITPTQYGLNALREICELVQNRYLYQQWLPVKFPIASDEGPDDDNDLHGTDRKRPADSFFHGGRVLMRTRPVNDDV